MSSGQGEWDVPTQVFLERYAPAYPEGVTWTEAIASLLASDADADVVTSLRADLRAWGRFRNPVRVDTDELEVADGMHRVAATVLESMVSIRVAPAGFVSDDAQVDLEYRIVIKDKTGMTAPTWDEFSMDAAFGWLRSLPLGDRWATCPSMGFGDGTLSGTWFTPTHLLGSLPAALEDRARRGLGWELIQIPSSWTKAGLSMRTCAWVRPCRTASRRVWCSVSPPARCST